MRTPMTDSEGDRLTATVGGRETSVPEKNLCLKVSTQSRRWNCKDPVHTHKEGKTRPTLLDFQCQSKQKQARLR